MTARELWPVTGPTAATDASGGSLHDFAYEELVARLEQDGVRAVHARALWRWLYRDIIGNHPAARQALSPPLQRWLDRQDALPNGLRPACLSVAAETASIDGLTRKFLLRLHDGREIETVVMGYPGRFTACLSTQAGCAMGCVFCATGQGGFGRHLRVGEIVAQAARAREALRTVGHDGPRNLVLMGMGEPLHNYEAVMAALRIITDTRGLNIGPSRISVSTVGVVPGIIRFADERQPYNLAVSLHGATEEERAALVPVSRRWPLADVLDACRYYQRMMQRRIFFGWTLIAGTNDTPDHARRLAETLRGIDAHINLIPLNPTAGYHGKTTAATAVDLFQKILQAAGFPCTIRQRRGIDVAAGCGQLSVAAR